MSAQDLLNLKHTIIEGDYNPPGFDTGISDTEQERIRLNPKHFVEHYLGEKLWSVQEEIMQSLIYHDEVLVNSCHATGKTFLAARIALWWLIAHNDTSIITTGPAFRTVRHGVWKEIAVFVEKLGEYVPGININQTMVEVSPRRFILGVSTDKPGLLQGIAHSKKTLIIIDEACELEQAMWPGLLSLTSTPGAKVFAITNPINPMGPYSRMWKRGGKKTKRFTISAFDTPNFKQVGVSSIDELMEWQDKDEVYKWDSLISPKLAQKMLKDYGEDAPDFKARILGQFPASGVGSLIDLELLDTAFESKGFEQGKGNPVYGADIAHMGSDLTVLANGEAHNLDEEQPDLTIYGMESWGKKTLPETTDLIESKVDKLFSINVDADGIGAHNADELIKRGLNVFPVRFGSSPIGYNKERFTNTRTEAYFNFAQLLEQGKLHLWHIRHLRDEIFNGSGFIKWEIIGGKTQLEPKAKAKKRAEGIRGFDHTDALVLLCYNTIIGIDAVRPTDKSPIRYDRRRNIRKDSRFSGVV